MKLNIINKIKNPDIAKGILGLVLILLAVGSIFYWESYGREQFEYTEVIVLNQEVEQGTEITFDMLGSMKYDKNTVIANRIKKADEIVGSRAKTYIPKGLQLSEKFFEKSELVLKKDEYIFQIPTEWILNFPQTIRRGDRVYFYTAETAIKEPIASVRVAYVKDSANREVVDVTAERIDASAIATNIEIILNDEINLKLREMVEQGYKFILAYE